MQNVEWGEFRYKSIFNKIVQGRRLKKDDQISGDIPFVMAGTTNAGVVNYISNPVAIFPKNSITVDIFGNVFYRDYDFGAGDDTGVYWNNEKEYSKETMLFFAVSMEKSLFGKFSFGKKLRSSQSFDFKIQLPIKNGKIDFEFMESFIAEMEAERIAELEAERIAKLEAYLLATGLKDYTLTAEEQQVLEDFENGIIEFREFRIGELFEINSYKKRFDANKVVISEIGKPYVVRTSLNNGVRGYINEDEQYLNEGNTISFGQDTATMFYQEKPYFTGDKIKIVKSKDNDFNKLNGLFFISAMTKSFSSFTWGGSSFNVKIIENQLMKLPTQNKQPNYTIMETFISAIQKLVIKEVVLYADRKIAATKTVVNK